MKIEHVALQVSDPVALSRWYVEHLGLTVKRAQAESPFGHFLGDDGDAVMLEFYGYPNLPVPDYFRMEPLLLHVAFHVDDVAATRTRLMGAGAAPVGQVTETAANGPAATGMLAVGTPAPDLQWTANGQSGSFAGERRG